MRPFSGVARSIRDGGCGAVKTSELKSLTMFCIRQAFERWRGEHMAMGVATQCSQTLNTLKPWTSHHLCMRQAFERWRGEHTAMGAAVRRALDAGAPADALRPMVEAMRRHLWTMFAMKRAVLCSDSAPAILRAGPLHRTDVPASSMVFVLG